MDVGIAAYNVQPSSSTLPVPQQQLGCSPPGQSQHIQHGLYMHTMPYGPPQYHTALPVQYDVHGTSPMPPTRHVLVPYCSSIGAHAIHRCLTSCPLLILSN